LPFSLNQEFAVAIYYGLKIFAATLVSLQFSAPRDEAYCKIRVKPSDQAAKYTAARLRGIHHQRFIGNSLI